MNKIRISDNVTLIFSGDKPEWGLQVIHGVSVDTVSLTNDEIRKLIRVFVKAEREKYPGRDRNCPGCGATMFYQKATRVVRRGKVGGNS